jgi:hypothetical protein
MYLVGGYTVVVLQKAIKQRTYIKESARKKYKTVEMNLRS